MSTRGRSGASPPTVLWWGRSDPGYSRNGVLRGCFAELGWQVRDFRPALSALGDLQARAAGVPAADLVWVPCFRQRDVAAAARHARRTGAALCVDPLISAYDKQVDERAKLAPDSAAAARLRSWESSLLRQADRVIADTSAHAEYFRDVLGVDGGRISVVPVGADEALFAAAPPASPDSPFEVLFYGSFIALQGAPTIVRAAARLAAADVRVALVGDGPQRDQCARLARDVAAVRFEPWIDYRALAARIHAAHLVLGVFGTTPKAARVIPNKVYQALACARPVITRAAPAFPAALAATPMPGLEFVDAGDPEALAHAIDRRARQRSAAGEWARSAREIYERWFAHARVRAALAAALSSLGFVTPAASPRR